MEWEKIKNEHGMRSLPVRKPVSNKGLFVSAAAENKSQDLQ